MKKFMILHYGFIPPTDDEMESWNEWFATVKDRTIEKGHLPAGREITHTGSKDLPFGRGSLTGYTIITADSMDEAAHIAAHCPIVDSTHVYEIQGENEMKAKA